MSTCATTYLCYPKPDSRILPSGSSVVGFERHEDSSAWWEPLGSAQKQYFKSDAYFEEQRQKAAFLAKYPKSPPHPARSEPTADFFRDYEKFIATLACIQGIFLTRAGVYSRELEYNAAAIAAAAATQEAMNEFLTNGFVSAWIDLPVEAVRRMGTQTSALPSLWGEELAEDWLTAQAEYADAPTTSFGSWGHNPNSNTEDAGGWDSGGWASDTDSPWGGGGWGGAGWGNTWAFGWGGSRGPRPQSSRRYVRGGRRSMGAFFRPRTRRSRRQPILTPRSS